MTDRDLNPDTPHWLDGTRAALRPPPHLSLSEWADKHYYLSPESAAEPGRWRTLPYQREIMDAVTDPAIERITLMKSARIGATKIMNATIGYHMHHDPCPILLVQPTLDDAEGYSKEELAPMLRDCSVLAGLVRDRKGKSAAQTMLHKTYPGGILSMVGAHSARGFRRTSRRVVIFDEVDGYAASAGAEGDQIKLGIKRSEYYANRLIFSASTPTIKGISRIEPMFLQGDQRRYHLPCPQCDHRDILVFSKREDGVGHWMQWPPGTPEDAHFVCSGNGCVIEHQHKHRMVAEGGWIAAAPFRGHASFHIWAAYSYSPNATWGKLAQEFVDAKSNPEALKTFITTTVAETWQDRGEAPDWEKLYGRRERYDIATVPAGVYFLTSGVDVQQDRFVYEVVGWGLDKQSWSIDFGVIMGDTARPETWAKLDEHLARSYQGDGDRTWTVAMMAIDSGYNTQQVYNWARRHGMARVIAVKGSATERTLIGLPSPVDVTVRGKRVQRGYKVWPVGVNVAKAELYGWLRLPVVPDGEAYPVGYCHFPQYGTDYFEQLTAEHLVPVKKKTGHVRREWRVLPGRENHGLDCRIYARAAAAVQGLDRVILPAAGKTPTPQASPDTPAPTPKRKRERAQKKDWLHGGKSGRDWLSKRRR